MIDLSLPLTAVIISIESFPNSLLRAKSMCAFLNLIFCHLLWPLYLKCILETFSNVQGQKHSETRAGKQVTREQVFRANVAAILGSEIEQMLYLAGVGK